VPGWYGQGITNAWERLRHGRVQNQTCDGDFSVSVSRVVQGGVAAVTAAVADRARRARWLAHADPALARALAAGARRRQEQGPQAGERRARALRFRWDERTIEPPRRREARRQDQRRGRQHGAAGPAAVERRRAVWKDALDGLKEFLSSPR
jgi:hypothetical protein